MRIICSVPTVVFCLVTGLLLVTSKVQGEASAGGKECNLSKECCMTGSDDQHVESHGDEEALNRYTEELNAVPALPEGEGEGEGEKPILLWWTEYIFPHAHSQKSHEIECTLGNCITSMDKNLTGSPATKAFIFYGTELSAEDLPLPRRPWHEWALFHEESPKNNWMLTNEEALSLFNHTATFRRESDYPLSTHFIQDLEELTNTPPVPTAEKNRMQREKGLAPVVYVQRDCFTPADRERYIKELMRYIPVDSYGPCLNNKAMPDNINGFHKLRAPEYYQFLAQYKFNIAFENAICNDYMTEKLFRPLTVGSVPVYKGSPVAKDWMPDNRSAIFADDFKSPQELAEYLKFLNSNDMEYDKFLAFKQPGQVKNTFLLNALENRPWRILGPWDKANFGHRMFAGFECHVCDRILQRQQAFRAHQLDPARNPPPPPRVANSTHLACPEPVVSIGTPNSVNKSLNFWEGVHEAHALKRMIEAQETDSSVFHEKYLKRKTDKYH